MHRLLKLFCLAVVPLVLSGCGTPPHMAIRSDGPGKPALETLATWMTGYFNSADQQAKDKEYLNIELRVARIWRDRPDGPWLYVEQATAATPTKPYRQRVYRLVYLNDGQGDRYESRVYVIRGDAQNYAGAAKLTDPLSDLTPDNLNERIGCTVIMRRDTTGAFAGSTDGESCVSDLRGAAYATAKVTVTANVLRSWDQGFSKDGDTTKQVWGAVKGPYEFKKISDTAK
jgi:hypothetical protein